MKGKTIKQLADLRPDEQNANKGTLRGTQLLDTSLERFGAGRSIVVDKQGAVIAGNKTLELAAQRGLDIQVVKSEGRQLVVVRRMDLDLDEDPAARQLAYLDNRTAEVGLQWDPAQLEADLAKGIELGGMFTRDELEEVLEPLMTMDRTSALVLDSADQRARFDAFVESLMAEAGDQRFADVLDAWVSKQLERFEAENGDSDSETDEDE